MIILEIFNKSHPGLDGLLDRFVGCRMPRANDAISSCVETRESVAGSGPGFRTFGVVRLALIALGALVISIIGFVTEYEKPLPDNSAH